MTVHQRRMHCSSVRSFGLLGLLGMSLLVGGLGCGLEEVGGDGGGDMIPPAVQQAFDESCATSAGCHASGSSLVVLSAPESSAILTAASASGGGPLVTLGDVDNSYIAQKILGGSSVIGGPMPPAKQSANDDVNLAIIVGWIAGVPLEGNGGGGGGGGDAQCYISAPIPAAPSFASDIWPILENRCGTTACHQVSAPLMPDAAGAYANLVSMPAAAAEASYVEPSDPNASYLWHKLMGTPASIPGGGGSLMPIGDELCAAEFQAIYAWIVADAPE